MKPVHKEFDIFCSSTIWVTSAGEFGKYWVLQLCKLIQITNP